MRRLISAMVWLLALAGVSELHAQASGEFLFAARRTNTAEIIDAVTLETVARIHFDFLVERLSASADGSRLEVAGYVPGESCCKHYRLELATGELEAEPPSRERSDYGDCLVSPDGRWCFRLKSFRGPALRADELREAGTSRVLTPPGLPPENATGNWFATGVWAGAQFYLYVERSDDPGLLWTVLPGTERLGAGMPVGAFGEVPGCRQRLPVVKNLLAAAGRVFLYEPFGGKSDRTGVCGEAVPGGAWRLDTTTGRTTEPIALGYRFSKMIADGSGSKLYGVVPGRADWGGPVQLVEMQIDGSVTRTRSFDPGVLQIAIGSLAKAPVSDVAARGR
jgi:hypothetical protein